MVKNSKKILASILSLILCSSCFGAAFADEVTTGTTNAGEYGEVEITITTEVIPSDPEKNAETDLIDSKSTTESSWIETPEEAPDSEPGFGITKDVDFDIDGESTTTETISKDTLGREVEKTTTESGKESITITETTTDIAEEHDVLLGTDTDDPTLNKDESDLENEEISSTDDQKWESTGNKTEGKWVADTSKGRDGVTEGEWESDGSTTKKTENSEIKTDEPINAGINLKPNGKVYTSKKVSSYTSAELLAEELAAEGFRLDKNGNLITPNNSTTALANGGSEIVSYSVQKTESGYEVVKTIVTTIKGSIEEGAASTPVDGDITETSRIAMTPELSEEDAALLGGEEGESKSGESVKFTIEGENDENGEGTIIRTEIKEVKDASGKVIGYEITEIKTTTTKTEADPVASDADPYAGDPVEPDADFTSFVAPTRPEDKETVTDPITGITTTVTVKEGVDSNGNICYTVETVKTRAQHTIYSGSETIYGTYKEFNGTTLNDPEYTNSTYIKEVVETSTRYISADEVTREVEEISTRDNTQEVTEVTDSTAWSLIYVGDQQYFIIEGKMYAVVDKSSIKERDVAINDDVDYSGMSGDENNIRIYGEKGYGYKGSGQYKAIKDYYTGQDVSTNVGSGKNYAYTGYGLFSSFVIKDNAGDLHAVRQYLVEDKDGNDRYVYCVELGAEIRSGSSYSETRYGKTDGKENNDIWNGSVGTIAQVRSVATNGFWGTEEGLGSLQAVKDLMIRNGYAKEAALLTEGHALAATQAAIWEFGTGGTTCGNGNYVTYNTADPNKTVTTDDQRVIESLRSLLVSLAYDPVKGVAETIDGSDITDASIFIKEKADGVAENIDANEDNDVFDADLSFTLKVSTSSINGDMIVHVIQDGKTIASARLAGEGAANSNKNLDYGKIYPNSDGTYKISGLKLAENLKIDLNLTGVQHLDDGVYVYRDQSARYNWQDFVGVSTLEQKVDISVSMEFNVKDPEADFSAGGSVNSQSRVDTFHQVKTDLREESRTETTTLSDNKTEVYDSAIHDTYGTVTTTRITTEKTALEREWESKESIYFTYFDKVTTEEEEIIEDDPTPLAGLGEEILDDEVPLANAPGTGDISIVWYVLMAVATIGLAAVISSGKKKKA